MKILVTGGAGFIGSHTCVELLEAGHEVVVVDNLSNSEKSVIDRVEGLTEKSIAFYEVDLLDKEALRFVFVDHAIDAVIHFAGYKAVGESVSMPIEYYHNNITGTLMLCELMKEYDVKKMVFSSSATVYGMNGVSPLTEDLPTSATNPYGMTKVMIEQILRDLAVSDESWSISLLRYFNPIGAHKSGLIGENPKGIPNNLMPYITQVAMGIREKLSVFGDDYDTTDGTGVRDYIHVVDLAKGHIAALDYVMEHKGVEAVNLGTGTGYSVLDVVNTFAKVNDIAVPFEIVSRRPGDIATCFANPDKAKELYGWSTTMGLEEMCEDSWRWQQNVK